MLLLMLSLSISAQEMSFMTYNIKYDDGKNTPNSWVNRKHFLLHQIQFYEPDVLGIQEALHNQVQQMDSTLRDYSYTGVGRDDGKTKGEYSPIFYNKKKFKLLETSTFWLSETPEKVSMGWDAVCNRVCTYGLFEDKTSGQKFYVFNTHFDHVGKVARKESVRLIMDKIEALNTKDFPVILMGDLNAEPQAELLMPIKTKFNDSKKISELNYGSEGTYNGFSFDKLITKRIDYIFLTKQITVKKYASLADAFDLKYPSDHLPVFVEVRMDTQDGLKKDIKN